MLDSGDSSGSSGTVVSANDLCDLFLECGCGVSVAVGTMSAPPVVASAPASAPVPSEYASTGSTTALESSEPAPPPRQPDSQAGSEDAFVMVEDPDAFESALEAALNDTADMQADGPTEAELGMTCMSLAFLALYTIALRVFSCFFQ
jgi:hypothetical protein